MIQVALKVRTMLFIEDYSDERQKAWCIHCGAGFDPIPWTG